MSTKNPKNPLVWIDCEMTGLDPDSDAIIEIFCLITNGDLEILDQDGWGAVIHQDVERMGMMDEWCSRTHGQSGLTSSVIRSTITAERASTSLLSYIQKFVPNARIALLAGNTVHHDKAFLRKEPWNKIHDHLSYRILDVSSIKEAARRWSSEEVWSGIPDKKGLHRAKEDILESISEASYYRRLVFQS